MTNEQRTVIMFALIMEAGYEQRTTHNVRTLWGALNKHTRLVSDLGKLIASLHIISQSVYSA